MFDKIINYIAQRPKLHIFCLTWLFFGIMAGWIFIVMPFAIYDAWRNDFDPYFDGIKEIWNNKDNLNSKGS